MYTCMYPPHNYLLSRSPPIHPAQAARPRTVERRHQELQKAIYEELQRKENVGGGWGEVEDVSPSSPHEQDYLTEGWGVSSRPPQLSAVYVHPPRAPTTNP